MRLFESLLEQNERERHFDILSGIRELRRRRRDREADALDGYLLPKRAAAEMGLELEELAELVRAGMLETRGIGGRVYVRPAVVSRMAVSQS